MRQIGNVVLDTPLLLAPMAGVCNAAFRVLCRRQGAGLVCSEFVSANAIVHGNRKSYDMLRILEDERPVSIQIFGTDTRILAEAARVVEAAGADVLDFNMGCPVPKVIKAEAGAALMRRPDHAERVMETLVNSVSIPVTVKMRAGWDDRSINSIDLARRFERVGVAAIAVHGRTREQKYGGTANWQYIREVKQAVRIPVWGNGDVRTPQDAVAMLQETGCDGVMIGRGALGNPWIFRHTVHYMRTGRLLPGPTLRERIAMLKEHLLLLVEYKGESVAIREIRQHVPHYIKGLAGAASLRNTLNRRTSVNEFFDEIDRFCTGDRVAG